MSRRIMYILCALFFAHPARAAAQDNSGPLGTWYLRSGQSPVSAAISGVPGKYQGTFIDEKGVTQMLDEMRWDAKERRLEFRRAGNGWWQWYRGTVVEGIFV